MFLKPVGSPSDPPSPICTANARINALPKPTRPWRAMLSVSEAQILVLQHAKPLAAEIVPLGPSAHGLVLAEDVASDIDMPPYTKALMDGYAMRAADVVEGNGMLTVIEEVAA